MDNHVKLQKTGLKILFLIMSKHYSLIGIILFFIACERPEKKLQPEVPVKPDKPSVKTFDCDTSKSYVLWERIKEIHRKEEKIKLGKAKVNLKINGLVLRTQGTFKLHHGFWVLHPDSSASATLAVDLRNGLMLGVNDEDRLELMHPEYLDIKNYPLAVVSVKNFRENEKSYFGEYFITIKDSSAKIQPIVDSVHTRNGVPDYFSFNFNINAKKWKLHNPENANSIIEDKLHFDCVIVTDF